MLKANKKTAIHFNLNRNSKKKAKITVMALPKALDLIKKASQKTVLEAFISERIATFETNKNGIKTKDSIKNGYNL